MKIVIGGIIVGLVVAAAVICFIVLSDTTYVIVEKETIHPCQQLALDFIKSLNNIKNFDRYSATLQELEEFNEEHGESYEKKVEELKQNIIKYNCPDTSSEWNTAEFEGKMKFLFEYDFLP